MGFARGLRTGGAIPAAAALALAFSVSAVAQDAPAEGAAPDAESPWLKICNTDPATEKELCLVTQELRAENGLFIASATLRILEGEEKVSFIAAVPTGMLIQPGLRVQVDEGAQKEVKYGICFPNACYAEMEVDGDFLTSLKRGNQLIITVLNAEAKGLNFPLSLIGFTRTYDGEGVDAAAAQQRQEELNQALQRRAEEARQRLIDQQRPAGEAPAGN